MTICPQKPLLITIGEPAGIGSDCVLMAQQDHPEWFVNTVIVAPIEWLNLRAQELHIAANIQAIDSLNQLPTANANGTTLFCWNPLLEGLESAKDIHPIAGQPSAKTAKAVVASS